MAFPLLQPRFLENIGRTQDDVQARVSQVTSSNDLFTYQRNIFGYKNAGIIGDCWNGNELPIHSSSNSTFHPMMKPKPTTNVYIHLPRHMIKVLCMTTLLASVRVGAGSCI
jgi:hypothetical protein